ncbi:MAG TPA: MazG family protein [Streptosporangiaceae bacterium]|jgi:XTP/dITP diphosphohydrolase|nr:MazG family protein [Streptosporangiaceae bacterium]
MSLLFLATTHRVAPGLLSWQAWRALRSASRVLTAADHPQLPYVREADVPVEVIAPDARALVTAAAAQAGHVVWIASPDGDEELMRAVGALAVAADEPVELEVMHGSYDLPGARLLDLVSVMDTLRRECPWDRKQTHASLAPYLLEEAYEVLDTIESGDLSALREELGDVLLQVAFHSVVASERTDETAFAIDDVAAAIVDKLVRRHPHVFGSITADSAEQVTANWEDIKAAERAAKNTDGIFDGVPMGQPALTLAAQLQRRAARAAVPDELFAAGRGLAAELFALVRKAVDEGVDPETELRGAAREFRDRVEAWSHEAAPDAR